MPLNVISEYMSIERNSRVLIDTKTEIYVVECLLDKQIIRREIFTKITTAEDFAEDWIQCH